MDEAISKTANRRLVFGRRKAPPSLKTPRAPRPCPAIPALDTKAIAGRAFWLMGRNSTTYLALVAAAAVPERVAYHIIGADSIGVMSVLFGLTLLTCIQLYGAVLHGAMESLEDRRASFTQCLRAGLGAPIRAMLLALMTVFSVWFLLILPGLPLATRWAVAAPAGFTEGGSFRTALSRSGALVAPHRPQVGKLVLLLAGFAVMRAFPMLAIWEIPPDGFLLFMFGNWLFPLLLTAFTATAGAVLYRELLRDTQRTEALPPAVLP
jgi:hypothetical protein